MSYCLTPDCPAPPNPPMANYCQSCGQPLLLIGTNGQTYRGLKCIGAGGFGRTFLAVDDQQQPCVIKQLLPQSLAHAPNSANHSIKAAAAPIDGFSESYLQRFRQEAQRLAELGHHPQIPTLIDAIEHGAQGNALYLIQEFIAGLTLEEELTQQGPIDEQGARSLLSDLLTVLAFIHRHWVIHRDIKPQNIIRPQRGAPLVLVDFGAAKRTSQAVMALTGTVIGSAGYAAPEQIMGKAVFASDLYSLGVTCVHALTGMHPFDLYSISQDQWVWTQYLVTSISPGLQRLLDTLLCRAVNQRYRTAQAALTDLNALPGLSSPTMPHPDHSVNTVPQPSTIPAPPPSLLQRIKAAFPPFSNPPVMSPPPPWLTFTRASPAASVTPASSAFPAPIPQNDTDSMGDAKAEGRRQKVEIKTPQCPNASPPYAWHCTHTLTKHTNSVTAIAISPDSTLLASGDRQGHIYLWNLESGTLLHQFSAHTFWKQIGHRDRITDLQITADGMSLVSSSADGTLKQWDIGQRQLVSTLEGEGWVMSALTIHPDGHLLISGGANGAIDLWDLTRHQFIQRLWIHTDRINDLALAPDGVTLLSGSEDGLVYGWDLRTAAAIASIRAHHNGVSALVLNGEGQIMVSGGGDRTLRLWRTPSAISQSPPQDDTLSFHLLHTLSVDLDRVTAITMHPSGTLWANSQDDIHIQLWNLTPNLTPDMKSDLTSDLTPDLINNQSVAAPSRIQMQPQQGMVLTQDWSITVLRFSPRGDRLVSCSADGTIKIWQAQGGLPG